ncbi:hypothetical protein DXG01_016444 [Tephrocybe rancida]|nr:hypothetical protein DXG01_016444 [Tephrocybe rancida]
MVAELVLPTIVEGTAAETPGPTTVSSDALFKKFTSPKNIFGLSQIYHGAQLPTHDPEDSITLRDLDDNPRQNNPASTSSSISAYFPYPNKNSFALGNWFWSHGVQKSLRSFKELVQIVGSDDFNPKDIQNTRWGAIDRLLGQNDFDEGHQQEWEDEDAGWKRTPITLDIPFHKRMQNKGTQQCLVGHIYHRSIVSVIKEKLAHAQDNERFHYEPFEVFWNPTLGEDQGHRVYGESYTSASFVSAHRKLQESPREPGCDLPRCVVGLMVWSDSTHLTNFGNSKLWPSYIFFGNESKYNRCKPSLNLANHIAYFEVLPDSFKDFAAKHVGGKGPNKAFLAHCNREMYHAQWKIILDDEFLNAYEHGIVIKCLDGLLRRFYPRILTYSADYPEKVLLATIRNRGQRPCPRCTIPKSSLKNMGMPRDMASRIRLSRVDNISYRNKVQGARKFIYEQNLGVNSKPVEGLLKEESLSPVAILVVDILHDWEIGVWKAVFIQLIRLLHAADIVSVNNLDARYRATPTFGRDTIRKFSTNTSEMKKLAAHNYEDILQDDLTVTEVDSPEAHHFIGKTENLPIHVGQYVNEHFGDPAIEDFIPKLKRHILPRIQAVHAREAVLREEPPVLGDPDDWLSVLLRQDRIYEHNIMRLHYTSYDVRRGADIIHVKTSHCNIMLLNPDFNGNPGTDHPYLYAQVLGIYHANVVYSGHGNCDYHPRRVEFLWVRWYRLEEGHRARRLDQLSFPPIADYNSFGFVDPSDVLRGCHLISRFSHGKIDQNISSLAKDHKDWKCYYIDRFCDRDMLMRYYWGISIGHVQTRVGVSAAGNGADRRFKPMLESEPLSDSTLNEDPVEQPLHLSPIQEPEPDQAFAIGGDSEAEDEDEDDLDDNDMVFNDPELGSEDESVTGDVDDDGEDGYWTDASSDDGARV